MVLYIDRLDKREGVCAKGIPGVLPRLLKCCCLPRCLGIVR